MKECCNINSVVNDFYKAIYAYALKHTRDNDLAEDIVQEVMLRIVQAHKNDTSIQNIRAWLYQTTRFVIADFFREKKKLPINDKEDFPHFNIANDENLDISIFTEGMNSMINILPVKYSYPLRLSDIDNLPQKEIAHKLNLSLSATKMRIQRARKQLYDLFIECCDIEYDKKGSFISCSLKTKCSLNNDIELDIE